MAGVSCPVMIDSGFRRGGDVLMAHAPGARAVFVGRPFNYAGAVAGQAGILHAFAIVAAEMMRNMAHLGVSRSGEPGVSSLARRVDGKMRA
ncbi:4-hydroxymandelate oxidase [Paraburkholderia hiiakae]|uniref:4-hydroxymandelate oxidase n=1 Tax=Paraburkholderia hiiakae TaxID=1081782 RepID=A0ABM8NL67_9BURK|nr:4-hydroxymandelate oxidase [Paraburkholderia hiiakae]